jgi:hypothetical protein
MFIKQFGIVFKDFLWLFREVFNIFLMLCLVNGQLIFLTNFLEKSVKKIEFLALNLVGKDSLWRFIVALNFFI